MDLVSLDWHVRSMNSEYIEVAHELVKPATLDWHVRSMNSGDIEVAHELVKPSTLDWHVRSMNSEDIEVAHELVKPETNTQHLITTHFMEQKMMIKKTLHFKCDFFHSAHSHRTNNLLKRLPSVTP